MSLCPRPPRYHPNTASFQHATGSLCISYTIKTFGALTFATIMTTRQFLSILLSSLFFGSPLTPGQWCVRVRREGMGSCALVGLGSTHLTRNTSPATPHPQHLTRNTSPLNAPTSCETSSRTHPLRCGTFIVVTALYYQGFSKEPKSGAKDKGKGKEEAPPAPRDRETGAVSSGGGGGSGGSRSGSGRGQGV